MTVLKKILLLGGSAQQVVAIKTAKRLGYYTVLCDYLPDNPGQYAADKYYNVSTTDVEAVYKVAMDEKVDGILAYASDPAALPAAIVAERLGLPTNPPESVAVLGVKHNFRKFLGENGFACPRNFTFNVGADIEEVKGKIQELHFPIVVKPTDSSGSKGVTVLKSVEGLDTAIAWAESYSRNKILIVEEFIESNFPAVIDGDIFVWDGKVILYGEMACLRGNEHNGLIPVGEKSPAGLNSKQIDNVHKELQRIITMLGIKFGELNIEILLDKNDNVHFLELGPRAGGNMIPIELSDIFNVDLVEANVLAAMGENPMLQPVRQSGYFTTYVLHSYRNGQFEGVSIANKIRSNVYRREIYKKSGDLVESFDGAGKAVGILFLRFDTEQELKYFCSNHEKLVAVELME